MDNLTMKMKLGRGMDRIGYVLMQGTPRRGAIFSGFTNLGVWREAA